MHGFAEFAFTVAFLVAAWPLVAATVALELATRVRWRLLWSADPRWAHKFKMDVRMLADVWRADVRRLFAPGGY